MAGMNRCPPKSIIHIEVYGSLSMVWFYFPQNPVQPFLEPWLWLGGYQGALIFLERNIPLNTSMDVGYVPQFWVAVKIINNSSIKGFVDIHGHWVHTFLPKEVYNVGVYIFWCFLETPPLFGCQTSDFCKSTISAPICSVSNLKYCCLVMALKYFPFSATIMSMPSV